MGKSQITRRNYEIKFSEKTSKNKAHRININLKALENVDEKSKERLSLISYLRDVRANFHSRRLKALRRIRHLLKLELESKPKHINFPDLKPEKQCYSMRHYPHVKTKRSNLILQVSVHHPDNPGHVFEQILFRGSQSLTELRDSISCPFNSSKDQWTSNSKFRY